MHLQFHAATAHPEGSTKDQLVIVDPVFWTSKQSYQVCRIQVNPQLSGLQINTLDKSKTFLRGMKGKQPI